MMSEWQKTAEKIERLHSDVNKYRVEFIDEGDFRNLPTHLENPSRIRFKGFRIKIFRERQYLNLYISGFFGSKIADTLIKAVTHGTNVKIITEHIRADIQKMHEGGVKVRHNKNIHTRLFVAFNRQNDNIKGVLIQGSFDLDGRGLSGDRRDTGIITMHPDLVKSAVEYFEKVWEDHYHSKPLK